MPDKGYKLAYHFNAKHNLNKKKDGTHSHTFYIFLNVETLDEKPISINVFHKLLDDYFSLYIGQTINDIYPFDEFLPTVENMAHIFYGELKPLFLEKNVELLSLELGDSPFTLFCVFDCSDTENVIYPNITNKDIEHLKQKIFGNTTNNSNDIFSSTEWS